MPHGLRAFHPDVNLGPGGVKLRRRAIAHIDRVPFWWRGEREVVREGSEPGGEQRTIMTFQQWDIDEYNLERGLGLREKYPVLKDFQQFGPHEFSSERAAELAQALAEISEDSDVPCAESLALASRFIAKAAALGCTIQFRN